MCLGQAVEGVLRGFYRDLCISGDLSEGWRCSNWQQYTRWDFWQLNFTITLYLTKLKLSYSKTTLPTDFPLLFPKFWIPDCTRIGLSTLVCLPVCPGSFISSHCHIGKVVYCLQVNMGINCNWTVKRAFSCISWLVLGVSFCFQDLGKSSVCGTMPTRPRASSHSFRGW